MFADDLVMKMESSNQQDFQRQRQQLENSMNEPLEVLQRAVVSIPIAALQSYTSNPPVAVEIKKQAVNILVRMKASQRANWRNDWQKSFPKTQISPVEVCERTF
ncbi:hypothetical protein NPIL_84781 [Nephila pilipes]|uniref:Uncharacterized protein n=1 Tax=Nephila pilipes TaxID=299642 RepID=A0A8X6QL77_NEPPI|nr:hypothetical protein NPIL_84781 [Nephila pilipes]